MGSHHQPPPRPCMRSSYLPPKAPQHGEAWLCILSLCCTPRPHRPLCWDPGCMFAVPLPCIREQLSHSQLLVPHPDQGSKAGTSPGSDCTNTLILHASHPTAYSQEFTPYSALTPLARSLLTPGIHSPHCSLHHPLPKIFLNTKFQLPLGSPA